MEIEDTISKIKQTILEAKDQTDMSKELHALIREYDISKVLNDSKDESVSKIIDYLFENFKDRLFDGDFANYWNESELDE